MLFLKFLWLVIWYSFASVLTMLVAVVVMCAAAYFLTWVIEYCLGRLAPERR